MLNRPETTERNLTVFLVLFAMCLLSFSSVFFWFVLTSLAQVTPGSHASFTDVLLLDAVALTFAAPIAWAVLDW